MEFVLDNLHFRSATECPPLTETLTKTVDGAVSEYCLRLTFEKEVNPARYQLIWEEPQIDAFGFWPPSSGNWPNLRPDWSMSASPSRTASGMPLACIYNKRNENRITVALSDPANPTVISAGVVEETGSLRLCVELFSQLCAPMEVYEVTIRVDRRPIPFYDAVREVRSWWRTIGYQETYVPDTAKLPMYSTWYSFHQHTLPEEILAECAVAKTMGMDTVIVDDGWQTDDNSRGYAFCGDWKICGAKIPSMKDFVDRVHALGMKFMIWFSVPFVGFESENYERFKGMYLFSRPWSRAAILDPRFPEVRKFLVDTYCSYVKEYGWDGLKLDFIDSFYLTEDSSKDYDRMDTVSLQEAVEKLLAEATARLKAINPEFMIEFRESYVGPIVAKYGNIFRVTDCPNDPFVNRVDSVKLRLTAGDIAVHSDMIMWNDNETNEAVMYQLLGSLFAVPQISVRFGRITEDHRRLLANYLSFWRDHRETLANGKIMATDVEAHYSSITAEGVGERITVLHQSIVAPVGEDTTYLFNATGKDFVHVEMENGALCELYDLFGKKYREIALPKGISKVNLTNCGMAKIH